MFLCMSLCISVGVGGLGSFEFSSLDFICCFLFLFLISVRHFALLLCMKSAIQIKID